MKVVEKIRKSAKDVNNILKKPLNASITIRLDSDMKEKFEEACRNMGMTVSSAVSIFVNKVVKEQMIPFDVRVIDFPKSVNVDLKTDEELFREVDESLRDIENKKVYTSEEIDMEFRERYKNDSEIYS